ncbi:MAG: NAD(P)/FAD-dependent oxidoreductase, partial [Spirochaetaceae bacterium]
NDSFGRETSSRNSEVIHAGLYYPGDSLKARLCLRGRVMLYEFLEKYGLPYSNTGKYVVATNEKEVSSLEMLYKKALSCGALVQLKTGQEVTAAEPAVLAIAAIYSPNTGIFDTHAYMKHLKNLAETAGVVFAFNCSLVGIKKTGKGYVLEIKDSDGQKMEVESGIVINAAGLSSDKVAEMAGMDIDSADLRLKFSKGEYFRVAGVKQGTLKHLIYPVPGLASLGIHIVLDLSGGIKLGPNEAWVDNIDYTVNQEHEKEFFTAAKRYLPFLKPGSLSPDMAGMRPKLQKPGEAFRDFYIQEETSRGLPGLVNLIGIESPGLTSSLAIAEMIAGMI